MLSNEYMDDYMDKKVVGLFDFDDGYTTFKTMLKLSGDAAWEKESGKIEEGLYSKRKKYPNIYAMVLPVPEYRKNIASPSYSINRLEVELLFNDECIQRMFKGNNIKEEIIIDNFRIYKIQNKRDFYKKAMSMPKEDFNGFIPLFESIQKMFEGHF